MNIFLICANIQLYKIKQKEVGVFLRKRTIFADINKTNV